MSNQSFRGFTWNVVSVTQVIPFVIEHISVVGLSSLFAKALIFLHNCIYFTEFISRDANFAKVMTYVE